MARVPPCFPRRCFSISQKRSKLAGHRPCARHCFSGGEPAKPPAPPPRSPPLFQRGRTSESAGLLRQRVQVVLQVQYLLLSLETAFVSGHALSLVPDLHIRRVHLGLHFHPHRNGYRIEVGQHLYTSAPVHLRKMNCRQIKTFLRQSTQVFPLQRHPGAHRLAPLADPSLLIPPRFLPQVQVQGLPVVHLWHRHHVVPAKISSFAFHSTLLMY